MTIHKCVVCKYETIRKSSYDDHLLSMKHKKKAGIVDVATGLILKTNIADHTTDQRNGTNVLTFKCDICGQVFTKETNMYRHRRSICASLKDEVTKLKEEALKRELEFTKRENEMLKKLNG
jgi:rubredoxin